MKNNKEEGSDGDGDGDGDEKEGEVDVKLPPVRIYLRSPNTEHDKSSGKFAKKMKSFMKHFFWMIFSEVNSGERDAR